MSAPAAPTPAPLPSLAPGDRFQGELLVLDRTEKTPRTGGDPFTILTLGNSTGRIDTAPIWSSNAACAEGANRGCIVQVIGDVSLYEKNGSATRQLKLTAPLRVLPADQFDTTQFLESVGDCTRLWDWLDRQRGDMRSATLRSVVDLFFANDEFRTRFERTPGSVNGHHARLGGLLLHIYEVASIARTTARSTASAGRAPNPDLVIAGCLLHDIGKVEAYEVSAGGFSHTPCGLLLGHLVLGALMLERALVRLDHPVCSDGQLLELQHMILSHHGKLEFGSPVQPMTLEAEILHWADEASAKANDMSEALADDASFTTGGELSDNRPWRVSRKIWRRPHGWD